jgi:uncharacterized protein YjbI with pentapeptide repeats
MSQQEPTPVTSVAAADSQPPQTRDRAAWTVYWQTRSQPWRTEAEIDGERQAFLAQCRRVPPSVGRGVYPFGGVSLSRADVEWLLATHDGGAGPVQWSDERQHAREGLDLRGADLRGADLRGLPLARLCGGLTGGTDEQYEAAAIHLEGARLSNAALQGANLRQGHLEQVDLQKAQLAEASLVRVYLTKADLRQAQLQGADLREARLENADLREAHLEGGRLQEALLGYARLGGAYLEGATLDKAHLEGALLQEAHLEATFCRGTYFTRAYLRDAHFEAAFLLRTHLEEAHLEGGHLEGAELRGAYLQGTNLYGAHLEGRPITPEEVARLGRWRHWKDLPDHLPPADLRGAFLDSATNLRHAILGRAQHGYILLADVNWGGANLAVVPWLPRKRSAPWKRVRPMMLGDERNARRRKGADGKVKDADTRYQDYEAAVRANRQLAVALRAQGLDEDAAYFAYRAQVLQRQVLLRQYRLGAFSFSLFLDALAGYGYRPGRSLLVYLLVVLGWASAYFVVSQTTAPHLTPLAALIFSITSFHGRGFFPGGIPLDDPLTVLAAAEAMIGLVIEISFIATFTQRFFGK